jgi:hypothetical protein
MMNDEWEEYSPFEEDRGLKRITTYAGRIDVILWRLAE